MGLSRGREGQVVEGQGRRQGGRIPSSDGSFISAKATMVTRRLLLWSRRDHSLPCGTQGYRGGPAPEARRLVSADASGSGYPLGSPGPVLIAGFVPTLRRGLSAPEWLRWGTGLQMSPPQCGSQPPSAWESARVSLGRKLASV